MIGILPSVLLFVLCFVLFIREIKIEHEQFFKNERLADDHILREVERFVKEQESMEEK
ncbi:hypothetical protein [Flavobacterium sp.]|uniref:hypothetical protein n=1 Tax=Flavobacterium sp. TaxID=239 RepID=UPI0039199449